MAPELPLPDVLPELPLVELPDPEVDELPLPDVLLDELPLPDVLPEPLLDELLLVEVPVPLLAATTWAVVAGAALPHPAIKIGAETAARFKRTKTETFFLIIMCLTRGIGYVEHVSWSPSLLRKRVYFCCVPDAVGPSRRKATVTRHRAGFDCF